MRKFCVAVNDQGQLMVGEEMEEAEGAEGAGSIESLVGGEESMEGEESEGYLQPVEGLEAALAAVREFVASAGGGENQEMAAEREGSKAFVAGFKGGGM